MGAGVALTAVARSILKACKREPQSGRTLLDAAGYTSRTGNFRQTLDRLVQGGFVEMTVAGKPRSSKQEYRLTAKGRSAIESGPE
jgi:DNA-binding PadR family transcriptional regulator